MARFLTRLTVLTLKKTPLFEIHKSLGARMVPFAGWEMPVQYSGVIDEHRAVRTKCGLFDVSHMGEIEVSGPGALDYVTSIMTNDIRRVVDGQCQYTLLCYEDGGVVDDCIVYRFSKERFLFCVNASNADKVFEWMLAQDSRGAQIENHSAQYAQIALQGPAAVDVLGEVFDINPDKIKHFHFYIGEIDVDGDTAEALVSRTGYTGEDGFEIYLAPEDAASVWTSLMEMGKDYGIQPIGLGARDTLRLEMGYPLYGHELGEKITPIEAGLKKYVRPGRKFSGHSVLERQIRDGVEKTLVGIKMTGAGIPRAEYEVRFKGEKTGWITSGTSSPSLSYGIGMAMVEPHASAPGTELEVIIRDRAVKAEVTTLPFYKK